MENQPEYGLTSIQEAKLEIMALRKGWSVPEDMRAKIIDRISKIAAGEPVEGGGEISPSLSIKAFNSLVLAERMSMPPQQTNLNLSGPNLVALGRSQEDEIRMSEPLIDQLTVTRPSSTE